LALGGNWIARFEYLCVDLGSFDTTFAGLSGNFGVVVGSNVGAFFTAAGTGTIHSRITDNIGRFGLSYLFHRSDYGFRKSSGSLVMLAAIRRASSLVSRRPATSY
jgi:hypothetical protein